MCACEGTISLQCVLLTLNFYVASRSSSSNFIITRLLYDEHVAPRYAQACHPHVCETYIHPTLRPTNPSPPSAAETPVNTISGPYSVPYPRPASPCHDLELNKASLSGPETTDPMPRPAPNMPNTRPVSKPGSCFCNSSMIPGYVQVKPPAKRP